MKRGITVCALAAALLAASATKADQTPSTASGDNMAGNVQFLVGQTYLDDFWKPLDRPVAFGAEVDFAPLKSPIRVALAMHLSGDSQTVNTPYFGDTGKVGDGFLEFSAGFLWLPLRHGVARPYLGAGAVQMFAGVGTGNDFWSGGDSDHSFGFYADAGVYFKVGDVFNIGFDGRLVRGTSITIAGVEGNADYGQINMLFGFSWGE